VSLDPGGYCCLCRRPECVGGQNDRTVALRDSLQGTGTTYKIHVQTRKRVSTVKVGAVHC